MQSDAYWQEAMASLKAATNRALTAPGRKLHQTVAKRLFPYLTRRAGDELLFINWSYETDPPMGLPLEPADQLNRYPIQLYHATATQAGDLAGKRVLEVGCGHGGGASYLTRALAPSMYVGLDVNPAAIDFCRRHHRIPGLSFVPGDAGSLPFPEGAFDAVISVQAGFCFPRFGRFLREVDRVLRPGGVFLYADMRQRRECAPWDADLAAAPLRIVSRRDVETEVRRGIELNAPHIQSVKRSLGVFSALIAMPERDSLIYRLLGRGGLAYRMYHLAKATQSTTIGKAASFYEIPTDLVSS